MRERLQQLAQAWAELPPWAKRFAVKFAVAVLLAAAPHVPWAPLQDVTRTVAQLLREASSEEFAAPQLPARADGGTP